MVANFLADQEIDQTFEAGDSIMITFSEKSGHAPIECKVVDVEEHGAATFYHLEGQNTLGIGFSPQPEEWKLEWGGVDLDGVESVRKSE